MKRFLVLAAAASLLSGGCGTQVTGTATTSSPSAPRLPSDGAPAVAKPIAATAAVEADPCSAIPTAEIEAIGGKVKRTRVDDLTMGNACAWVFQEAPNTLSAGLVTGNKDGLSALYAQNATGGLTTFKPVDPVDGYPAVIYANGGEGKGNCTLAVGVRDDLVYTVIPRLTDHHPSYLDPCGMATKVAAAAIRNLASA
ncbi:DUF3558 domain-containing protein [Amycolatopsis roodepoortensis]|uniref:DUF3558 domain-containing protein n=1 Tax=Amycolatopsis roodepoortensis TaxID=700274 RepID=UPI00214CCAFF|nr:DUF3558 domain-containing protein [Amycolatopsis roodepoortensis]UUV28035.1 DUF3558 domain-containing protein [Amycolatopsis roodepoortensis]